MAVQGHAGCADSRPLASIIGMRGTKTRALLCMGWAIGSVAVAQDEKATAQAELDALNHLTQAVATMMEGASAESVRSAVIENMRHDPRWTEARKAVDRVVSACSEGAAIQVEIAALGMRAESEEQAARDRSFARGLGNLVALGTAIYSGGTLPLLKVAPTLLSGSGEAPSGTGASLAAKEQQWRRTLAEVGLELERMKEAARLRGSLPESDIVTLQDAQLFVRTMRDLDAGRVEEARRELLLLARARTRFPELQHCLGILYSGDSPQRALGYLRRAVDQSGDVLKEDRGAGDSALRLGMAALSEGIWADAPEAREAKLREAADWGRRCLKYQPRSTYGHVLVALADAERVREYGELIDVCEEVLEIDPDHSWARANVIDALSRMGRLKEALPQIDELLRRSPGWATTLLASEVVGESKSPRELSQILTPRIELRAESLNGATVPIVRNTGRVPLTGVWAVATLFPIPAEGRRRVAVVSAPWPRLDPGTEAAFTELRSPLTLQGIEIRLYAENGFAMATLGEGKAESPFEGAGSERFQAWAPTKAPGAGLQPGGVWFQVVKDPGGAALLVSGGEALLHKVQVGIAFGEAEGQQRHALPVRAWDPTATLRIPLPQSFADALSGCASCDCYVKSEEGTAVARMPIDTGVRALRFRLRKISLARADFTDNDDGATAAPELFVTVRRNDDDAAALSTQGRFDQDSFESTFARDEPSFEGIFSGSDKLRIRLWDADLASDDLLLEWNIGWEEIRGVADALTLTSKNSTAIVFEVEKLK